MADGRERVQFFRQWLLFCQSMAQPSPSPLPEPRQSASTTLLNGLSVLTKKAPPCCKRGVAEATTQRRRQGAGAPLRCCPRSCSCRPQPPCSPTGPPPRRAAHKQVLAAHGELAIRTWQQESTMAEGRAHAAGGVGIESAAADRHPPRVTLHFGRATVTLRAGSHAHEGVGDTPRERHVWCARKTRGCAGTRSRRSSSVRCGLPPTQRHQSLRR